MIRLAIFVVVLGGWGLIWGGQGVYTAMTNTTPTEMTLAEYIEKQPESAWLKLTNCYIDMTQEAHITVDNRLDSVYIPLFVYEHEMGPSQPIHVLLHTTSHQTKNFVTEMGEAYSKSEEEIAAWEEKNIKRLLRPDSTVEGLLEFGVEGSGEERRLLKGLGMNLTPDFVVLSDGGKPSMVVPVLVCLAGLLAIGGVIYVALFGAAGGDGGYMNSGYAGSEENDADPDAEFASDNNGDDD